MRTEEEIADDAHQRLTGECCKDCQHFDASSAWLHSDRPVRPFGTCLRHCRASWHYGWCEHWVERLSSEDCK